MKKYILIPDLNMNGTSHFFEVPSDFFVHAKACCDGVAIVIGGKTNGTCYGHTVPAGKSDLPVIERLVKHGDTAHIENMIYDTLCTRIAIFLEDKDKAVLNIREHLVDLCEELGYILHKTELPEMSGESKQEAKKCKKQKNN